MCFLGTCILMERYVLSVGVLYTQSIITKGFGGLRGVFVELLKKEWF